MKEKYAFKRKDIINIYQELKQRCPLKQEALSVGA